MAQTDLLKRYLDAGVAFTQMTQAKAEEVVRELVKAGEVQTADARKRVEELLDRSKENSEGIVALVRSEVQNQLAKLGLTGKNAPTKKAAAPVAKATTAAKKTVAKKAPAAKKAVAKKTVAKKAPAKKTAAKKTVAKKAPAAQKTAAAKRA
jgi:polyhydroxyalkanoate synthesis regulator phasin